MAKARWVEGLGVTLLVLELLLLAVPVTVLDGFGLLVLAYPNSHPDHTPMLVGTVVATVALIGFWRLTFGFLLDGLSLKRVPAWARWSAGSGALLCLLALLVAAVFDRLTAWALVGVFGLPVMVPLGHMLAVSWGQPTPPPLP
ncbi:MULTISPECIES: hypothetical protein [unclassified Stenotrophomonas]|jgi:hypothetical protein|uniref:hypothetical protein n=1 Tax=unclassified Stenotrophomonas TaxID=196198 RepID=UPI002119021F|nr:MULTISPECIES: hypothetical protein [unclassified Stenotrophomonas]